jgi:hypothetical protein
MIRIGYKKEQKTTFPSFQDSLLLYKDAIINSINKEDLKTADINLQRLIPFLKFIAKKNTDLTRNWKKLKSVMLFFRVSMDLVKILRRQLYVF